jgi:hypothetical protein
MPKVEIKSVKAAKGVVTVKGTVDGKAAEVRYTEDAWASYEGHTEKQHLKSVGRQLAAAAARDEKQDPKPLEGTVEV